MRFGEESLVLHVASLHSVSLLNSIPFHSIMYLPLYYWWTFCLFAEISYSYIFTPILKSLGHTLCAHSSSLWNAILFCKVFWSFCTSDHKYREVPIVPKWLYLITFLSFSLFMISPVLPLPRTACVPGRVSNKTPTPCSVIHFHDATHILVLLEWRHKKWNKKSNEILKLQLQTKFRKMPYLLSEFWLLVFFHSFCLLSCKRTPWEAREEK